MRKTVIFFETLFKNKTSINFGFASFAKFSIWFWNFSNHFCYRKNCPDGFFCWNLIFSSILNFKFNLNFSIFSSSASGAKNLKSEYIAAVFGAEKNSENSVKFHSEIYIKISFFLEFIFFLSFFIFLNPFLSTIFRNFQSMGNNRKVLTASLLSLLLSMVLAQFEPPVGGGPPGKPCSSSFHCWRTEPINVFGEPVGLLQGTRWCTSLGCDVMEEVGK